MDNESDLTDLGAVLKTVNLCCVEYAADAEFAEIRANRLYFALRRIAKLPKTAKVTPQEIARQALEADDTRYLLEGKSIARRLAEQAR